MSLLNFLKSGAVTEAPVENVKRAGGRSKQWAPNPSLIAIRVWYDGSVFPSQAAIEQFDLEYKDAVITLKDNKRHYDFPDGQGNGLDVILSTQWKSFNASVEGKMLFVAVTPKKEPKVDLFSSTNYEETGKPKTIVSEQGANTYGNAVLLPALKEIYGIELTKEEGKDFVDLVIFESLGSGLEVMNITEHYSKPITFLPKVVSRGEDKGKLDYVKRENVKIYGFAPKAMVDEVNGVSIAEQ